MNLNPIGIFDSGVGGLSVLRAIRRQMPSLPVIYLADQGHVPYGPRPLEEVRSFSEAVTRFLLTQGARLIVVACNTASAAALHYLRQTFPETPFVGMEPAVKPAAETTQTGVVGVLATPATFQGALYASVVERFANGVTLLQHTCPGLVQQIEAGELDTPKTRAILEDALNLMLAQGIDTVVLGCTHYPFVIPLIQEIVGEKVRVIDPAPAVARQVGRLVGMPSGGAAAAVSYFTTGNAAAMAHLLPRLVGEAGEVREVKWGMELEVGERSGILKLMNSGYREIAHTADWELEVWAPDLTTLLEQAARGMYALAGACLNPSPRLTRSLDITAPDAEILLVKFLSELLYLGEDENLGFDAFDLRLETGNTFVLRAAVAGAPLAALAKEIKAVTYHNLAIRETESRLEVRIVFDV